MAGLLAPQFQDADAARKHLESIIWPDGPVCPHCGIVGEAFELKGKSTRKGLYKCSACRQPFTVTVKSIFEDSKIPLNKWLLAIHLMCSSKKGISALQLQRELWGEHPTKKDKHGRPAILGSYRTAWFMCHRVRWAMTQSPMLEKLSGVVEVDETYVGGREPGLRKWRSESIRKTPVLALVERGGKVRSFPIERATLKNIKPILAEHIDPSTHLVTDESNIYYMTKPMFDKHSTVVHSKKEYARREGTFNVTTNTVESFFALLKRSNYGVHHHMSRKYLDQYCAERDFVYNGRKMSDSERSNLALRSTTGKRMMLKAPKEAKSE